jgi:hypothetical protein
LCEVAADAGEGEADVEETGEREGEEEDASSEEGEEDWRLELEAPSAWLPPARRASRTPTMIQKETRMPRV